MSKTQINLQDTFLNQLRRDEIEVTVSLTTGLEIRGWVKGFDSFTVILEGNEQQILVYKHAIAIILPERPVCTAANREQLNT